MLDTFLAYVVTGIIFLIIFTPRKINARRERDVSADQYTKRWCHLLGIFPVQRKQPAQNRALHFFETKKKGRALPSRSNAKL
jgi:hypothetical protein